MALVSVVVWNGHDNTFSLELSEGGTPVDLVSTNVSRMVIITGPPSNETLDSDVLGEGAGNVFDWATNGASGIVEIDLSQQSLSLGPHYCTLVVYDPLHTNGQVWGGGDDFRITIKPQQVT